MATGWAPPYITDPMEHPKYMRPRTVMETYGISVSTLCRWLAKGLISEFFEARHDADRGRVG